MAHNTCPFCGAKEVESSSPRTMYACKTTCYNGRPWSFQTSVVCQAASHRKTVISKHRIYRYTLWREWDPRNSSYACFIGLNPSTADETADDPTIRRCVDYAKRWGYGALCMLNLYALRSTDPKAILKAVDPVGPDNDAWLMECTRSAGVVVAAWGSFPDTVGKHAKNSIAPITSPRRDIYVENLLRPRLTCLSLTKQGYPGHPLYLKKDLKPAPFSVSAEESFPD